MWLLLTTLPTETTFMRLLRFKIAIFGGAHRTFVGGIVLISSHRKCSIITHFISITRCVSTFASFGTMPEASNKCVSIGCQYWLSELIKWVTACDCFFYSLPLKKIELLKQNWIFWTSFYQAQRYLFSSSLVYFSFQVKLFKHFLGYKESCCQKAMVRYRQKCVYSSGSRSCFAIASHCVIKCDASCCHGRKPSSASKLKPSFIIRKIHSLSLFLYKIRWTIPFLAICFRKVCPLKCQHFITNKKNRFRQFPNRLCMYQFKTTLKRKREPRFAFSNF